MPPEMQTKHENGKVEKSEKLTLTRRKIAGGGGKTLRNMIHVRRGKQKGGWTGAKGKWSSSEGQIGKYLKQICSLFR